MVRARAHRCGLTLVELLVVLAILGILAGLLLAAVQQVREAGRRADCSNRLRQQGLAVLKYESDYGRLPPGAVQGPFPLLGAPSGVSHGMWPFVLPNLEQQPAATRYRFDRSYDDPVNQPAVTSRVSVLLCPNGDPGRVEPWDATHYGAVADYGPVEVSPFLADLGLIDPAASFEGALPVNGAVRIADVLDGTSTTLLLVEAGGRPGMAWSSPQLPVGLRQVLGSGLHRDGASACMVDGSVHFLRNTIDLRVLARLATRAGGEAVNGDEY